MWKKCHVMNNFTYNGDFSNVAVGAVLAIEAVSGLIANTFVLSITLYQWKTFKQSSTIFFTSLILANLIMVVLHFPFTIIALAAGEWIFGSTDEEKRGTCTFAAFTFWYSSLVLVMTVVAISFDRFLFIVKPHLHKRFMRPWVALTLTIAIWLLSAVLSSAPFYGVGDFGFIASIGMCLPFLIKDGSVILAFLILILSLLIIVTTSLWTFCFTWWFLHKRSMIVESNIYSSKKRGLFGIFGAMLLVYGISKAPRIIALVLVQFEVSFGSTSLIVIYFVYQLSIIADPMVQSFFRPGFKEVLVSLFKKCSRGVPST